MKDYMNLTVKQFIEKLKQFDENSRVEFFFGGCGYDIEDMWTEEDDYWLIISDRKKPEKDKK
jgi:hypothetical protein